MKYKVKTTIVGIVCFIIGLTLFVSASTYNSSEISYDNNKSNADATNVKEAIDDLYKMSHNNISLGTSILASVSNSQAIIKLKGKKCELYKGNSLISSEYLSDNGTVIFNNIDSVGNYTVKIYYTDSIIFTNSIDILNNDIINNITKELSIDCKIYLYNYGNEYNDITGGWTLSPSRTSTPWNYDCVHNGSSNIIQKTKNDDNIVLYAYSTITGSYATASIYTSSKVSLNNYKKIGIDYDYIDLKQDGTSSNQNGEVRINLLTTLPDDTLNFYQLPSNTYKSWDVSNSKGNHIEIIDVSETNSFYIMIFTGASTVGNSKNSVKIKLNKVWLEF